MISLPHSLVSQAGALDGASDDSRQLDGILEDTTRDLWARARSKVLESDSLATLDDSTYLETMMLRMEEMEVS